jgi:hypothetical protein
MTTITPAKIEAARARVAVLNARAVTMREDALAGKRPNPTLGQIGTFTRAVTLGQYVPDDVRREREAACGQCSFQRFDDGIPWCSICNCGTSDEERKIFNLTRYEESPLWGCKHPDRNTGAGWKR